MSRRQALSPQRQLVLLAQMARLVRRGNVQFLLAMYCPILMTFPGATLWAFDGGRIEPTRLQDTSHYHITHGILSHPERDWQHLSRDDEEP